MAVLAGAGFPVGAAAKRRGQAELGPQRPNRWTMHLGAQQAADEERLVAYRLCRQAEPWAAGKQLVVRIALDERRRNRGALAIRCRGDDKPQQLLHLPAKAVGLRRPELNRKPVEQFRVVRQLAAD